MIRALLCVLMGLFHLPVTAQYHISFEKGESTSRASPGAKKYTVGYVHNKPFYQFSNVNVYLGIDASYWDWDNHYGNDITGGAMTPTLTINDTLFGVDVFYRIGIGLTYVDAIKWHNRDLGDNWLFENKAEFGISPLQHHTIKLAVNHYSNAGLNQYNDGTNLLY
ncbi:acyloxyacyl hydrolase, partial [Thalassotalea euphylliae]|uniref:acyloxyacyl hydrolase n=1 Tax=Thalassotalea euphylliae TaxID=1655234 RepID=UPI003644497D